MPPDTVQPSRSTDTMTVGCNLPHGLILELAAPHKESSALGGKEVDVYHPTGEKVVIAGALSRHPDTSNPGRVVAGYGLTEVAADFWHKWVALNKDFPPLVKGMLFAQPTRDKAGDKAKGEQVKTGLDPLDQDKPAPGITKATAA